MEKIEINGRICYHTDDASSCEKLLIWPMGRHEEPEIEQLFELLAPKLAERKTCLAAWRVEDWNRELSPWSAPAVFGEEDFAGEGASSLRWLTDGCIPYFQDRRTRRTGSLPVYLGGYSLAGLFALWALHETERIDGAASCSGSLWFPGFIEYAKRRTMERASGAPEEAEKKIRPVYLSLGSKEAKNRNPVLSTIKDCTEELYGFYRDRPDFYAVFEENPGNHFHAPMERLAKGLLWLAGR